MKKQTSILLQVVIWVSIWLIFTFSTNTEWRPANFYWLSSIRILTLAMFFNLVYYGLLLLYFSDKKRQFFILSSICFIVFVLLSVGLDQYFFRIERITLPTPPPDIEVPFRKKRPFMMRITPPFFMALAVFGVAAAARGFSAFEGKKQAVEEANRRRLEAELALLKSQINPHFLLNTLNNIYTLSIIEPNRTPDALLKLSEMMKYILNDCAKPKVALSKDIAFIENYLNLQQLRLPPNVKLKTELPAEIPKNSYIEPMILIPFIENAFKHGVTTTKNCEIIILIKINNNSLFLTVQNELFKAKPNENTTSGMGISNTRQRLESAYSTTHTLQIEKVNNTFWVNLNIQF